MGYDSLQKDSHARVPSIAYTSAGDCYVWEDSQSNHPVRMQFFRVPEPPLVTSARYYAMLCGLSPVKVNASLWEETKLARV